MHRVGSILIHPLAIPFLAFAGMLGFITTFSLAYYIGGTGFFGPVLLTIWGSLIAVLVIVLEKSGYARNFRAWDFPFRKMLYGIPGLFLALGVFYFLIYFLSHYG